MTNKIGSVKMFMLIFFLQNLLLIIWRHFQPTSLIVDQSFLICLSIFITSTIMLRRKNHTTKWLGWISLLSKRETYFISIISILSFSLWVLLVPGTVERSRSLAIFQWVQYGHSTHLVSEIETELRLKYDGFDLEGFRLRLHEHRVRGLLAIDEQGRVVLTFAGKLVYLTAEGVASIYSLHGWYRIPLSPTNY